MAKSSLGTAYVQIVPSAEGISSGISRVLAPGMAPAGQSAGRLFSGGMKGMMLTALAAAGAAAGAAAIAGIAAAVKQGAKLEQSIGGIETLFKSSSDTVIKNANKAWKTAGVDANSYMEQATSFAAALVRSTGGNTEKAAKSADMALIDMSDNANKMGTDLKMLQQTYQSIARGNYEMLDNLKLGYGGTKTEMERLLADAEKLTGKKYDISNLNDVYSAIHVIQKDLGITGTTAEEAEKTVSGSFNAMKAAGTNLLGALSQGKGVGKAFENLANTAQTFFMNNLFPMIGRILEQLPNLMGVFITKGLPKFIVMLHKLAPKISNGIASMLDKIANGISTYLNNLGKNPAMTAAMIKSGLLLMVKLRVGVLKGVYNVVKAFWNLRTSIASAIGNLAIMMAAKAKNAAANFVKNLTGGVVEKFKSMLKKIKDAVNKIKMKLHLKVPKLTVDGGKAPWGIGGAGRKPKFTVKWQKQAMQNPYMFSGATLFGAGEAGDEVLYGRKKLMNDIGEASAIDYNKLGDVIASKVQAAMESVGFFVDGKELAHATAGAMGNEINKINIRAQRRAGKK